jgi:hypothetical protein
VTLSVPQEITQGNRHALVEEDPQAGRSSDQGSRFSEAQFSMPEHRVDLQTSHAREPGEEVVHSRSVLNILEERLHWYARVLEYPRAADPYGSRSTAEHCVQSSTSQA